MSSSPDPARVREALEWWESAVYMEFTEAEEDHVKELADAARAWRSTIEPDYEAAARAIARVDDGSPYETLPKPLQRLYDEMTHSVVNAALGIPGDET